MSDPIDSAITGEHNRQERAWDEAMTNHTNQARTAVPPTCAGCGFAITAPPPQSPMLVHSDGEYFHVGCFIGRKQALAVRDEPTDAMCERAATEIERYGEGLVPELRLVCTWLASHFRGEDGRAAMRKAETKATQKEAG